MKIGILTQPLHTNYGGLLQAYALQTVLKRMGHEALIVDRRLARPPLLIKFFSVIKRLAIFMLYFKPINFRFWPTNKEYNIIAQHTKRFVEENIQCTKKVGKIRKFSLLNKYRFEVYIVGSDQVWRPVCSPCITNEYFDFLDGEDKVKKIAYAASFGVDNWELSSKKTKLCAALAQKINAISVREDSAINLCEKYLGVKAMQVLDPTLLLKKEDYIKLIEKDNSLKSKGSLMIYILDKTNEKEDIVNNVAKELDLTPFSVMPRIGFENLKNRNIEDCIFPSVTAWIRGFLDADFIVTDSFHGTVFSIIFNKPFISIGNLGRGMTRFTSLLKIVKLEDRLILSSNELTVEKMHNQIDFEKVNDILEKERQNSINFLHNTLV